MLVGSASSCMIFLHCGLRMSADIANASSARSRSRGTFIGVGDLNCSFQLSRRVSIILVCALEICSK